MEDIISKVEAEFLLFKNRLIKLLATTPDDRINWSPSPTARTPLEEVAHVAQSIKGLMEMYAGNAMDFSDIRALDASWRQAEKCFTTREQALALLEENSNAYVAWLHSLTPDQVASTLETPMGPHPMSEAITWVVDHTRSHISQLEYIQTIYGDLDWHMM